MKKKFGSAGSNSNPEGIPTTLEVWRALQTLAQHAHITVQTERDDRDISEGSINMKLVDVVDAVLPYENENDYKKFQWNCDIYDETDDVMNNVMPDLKKRYSDFSGVVSALDIIERSIGQDNWKKLVEQQYTPNSIMNMRARLNDIYMGSEMKTGITVQHSAFDNSRKAQDMRSRAVPAQKNASVTELHAD